ncbi:hypothetical protein FRB99_005239 [Tulasnella sp. 403]|nr:hypothetical protein FRB99_005239 [Tulasnella sp. 403]
MAGSTTSCRPALIIIFTLLLLFIASPLAVHAASLNLPLQSQAPRIAFVSQPYNWTFNTHTFVNDRNTSQDGSLSYRLSSAPSWLVFDSLSRTFSGTPGSNNIGSTRIDVFASAFGEAETTDSFRLVVSNDDDVPVVSHPLSEQFVPNNPSISSAEVIPATGDSGALPAVKVPQAWSFSVGLRWDTFKAPSGRKIYYTPTLTDGSPLPLWLVFSSNSMTFDGVTPKIRGPNETTRFDITLHGAGYEGFSAVEASFSFVVDTSPNAGATILAQHSEDGASGVPDVSKARLTQEAPLLPINVTVNEPFIVDFHSFDLIGLYLDGKVLKYQDVDHLNVDLEAAPWLTYSNTTGQLSGTPPSSLLHGPSLVLPISMKVASGNLTFASNLTVQAYPSAFTNALIPAIFAPPSSRLFIPVGHYLTNPTKAGSLSLRASFDPPVASSWATFNPNNTLVGTVPSYLDYQSVTVRFYATIPETNATSSMSLPISLAPQSTLTEAQGSKSSKRKAVVIAVTIVLVVLVILACSLLVSWLARRRKGSTNANGDAPEGGIVQGEKANSSPLNTEIAFEDTYSGVKGYAVRSSTHLSETSTAVGSASTKSSMFQTVRLLTSRVKGDHRTSQAPSVRSSRTGERASLSPGVSPTMPLPVPRTSIHIPSPLASPVSPPAAHQVDTPAPEWSLVPLSCARPRATSLVVPSTVQVPTAMVEADTGGAQVLPPTSDSSEMIEGVVDRTSWAEEPNYVWTSGKVIKSPKLKQGFNSVNTGSGSRLSLDSITVRRRSDVGTGRSLGDADGIGSGGFSYTSSDTVRNAIIESAILTSVSTSRQVVGMASGNIVEPPRSPNPTLDSELSRPRLVPFGFERRATDSITPVDGHSFHTVVISNTCDELADLQSSGLLDTPERGGEDVMVCGIEDDTEEALPIGEDATQDVSVKGTPNDDASPQVSTSGHSSGGEYSHDYSTTDSDEPPPPPKQGETVHLQHVRIHPGVQFTFEIPFTVDVEPDGEFQADLDDDDCDFPEWLQFSGVNFFGVSPEEEGRWTVSVYQKGTCVAWFEVEVTYDVEDD